VLPLSARVQTSYTDIAKPIPAHQNGVIEFPQQLNVYLAGEIAHHVGSYVQLTYTDQSGTIGFDNSDIRFATHTTLASEDLLFGLSLNDSPTYQDIWNSTPGWGFPFVSSATAPTPITSTLIEGRLNANVAGLGAYALWDNLVFAELSGYRSVHQGGPIPRTQLPPEQLTAFHHTGASHYSINGETLTSKLEHTGYIRSCILSA